MSTKGLAEMAEEFTPAQRQKVFELLVGELRSAHDAARVTPAEAAGENRADEGVADIDEETRELQGARDAPDAGTFNP
jgi:hypothetical protein